MSICIYMYMSISECVYIMLWEMKSQTFVGMLIQVSWHCISQVYYLLHIFSLPRINRNRNLQVCSKILLSKKPLHTGTSQLICIVKP